ncbi:hypothetical protein ACFE04_000041 [Oxalis oulophora]
MKEINQKATGEVHRRLTVSNSGFNFVAHNVGCINKFEESLILKTFKNISGVLERNKIAKSGYPEITSRLFVNNSHCLWGECTCYVDNESTLDMLFSHVPQRCKDEALTYMHWESLPTASRQ